MGKYNHSNLSHKDLARLANVTQPTVSRALDPSRCHLISPATRQRIVDLAQELGFQPNIHARRTRSKCSEAITLVIDDITASSKSSYDFNRPNTMTTFEQVNGIIDGANDFGFDVKFLPLYFRRDIDVDSLSQRIGFPYSDGVFFLGFHYLRQLAAIAEQRRVPVVVALATVNNYACVNVDPLTGYRQLITELKQRGRGRIAFCGIDKREQPFQVFRHTALRQALAEDNSGEVAEVAEFYFNSLLDIRRQMEKLSREPNGVNALVCSSDSLALHIRNELAYLGTDSRFSIVGYAGEPQFGDLASIVVPRYDICRLATRLLIEAIRAKKAPDCRSWLLPSTLRLGTSL
ncbi:MAG: LacI family transcriptional regulator [Lentisphaerae bacterium]|nr:LacI family transcriptional regulator [Lentisphaerota bacterium]